MCANEVQSYLKHHKWKIISKRIVSKSKSKGINRNLKMKYETKVGPLDGCQYRKTNKVLSDKQVACYIYRIFNRLIDL